jgi:hypothetical protein
VGIVAQHVIAPDGSRSGGEPQLGRRLGDDPAQLDRPPVEHLALLVHSLLRGVVIVLGGYGRNLVAVLSLPVW